MVPQVLGGQLATPTPNPDSSSLPSSPARFPGELLLSLELKFPRCFGSALSLAQDFLLRISWWSAQVRLPSGAKEEEEISEPGRGFLLGHSGGGRRLFSSPHTLGTLCLKINVD